MSINHVTLSSHFLWTLRSFTVTDYAWATLAIFVIGWFLCSRKDA